MSDFKVGDRVRYIVDGDEGLIKGIHEGWFSVNFDKGGLCNMLESDLELVSGNSEESKSFEQNVRRITDQIADLLIAKNKAYGDSALNPIRVFSKSDRIEQLNVRIDDKISRIQRGTEFEGEDTERDLIGYLILKLIAKESE